MTPDGQGRESVEGKLRAVPIIIRHGPTCVPAACDCDQSDSEPDYPALAAVVEALLGEQDAALKYSARERVRLGEVCREQAQEIERLRGAIEALISINIVNIFDSAQTSLYPEWIAVARTHFDAARAALRPAPPRVGGQP